MKVIPKTAEGSELADFAAYFHHNFTLIHQNADEGAFEYFRSLSSSKQSSLRVKLQELLNNYPGKDQKCLRNAWFRLGAQWWDSKCDMRAAMTKWIHAL